MNIHDCESIAFRYLAYLNDVGRAPVNSIGWDLGLSNNEIKDVVQYLRSLGMLEFWSGSRGWRMSDILSLSASVSDRGEMHVRTIRIAVSHDNTSRDPSLSGLCQIAPKQYRYVGPEDVRDAALQGPAGMPIRSVGDIAEWLRTVDDEILPDGSVVATFTISTDGFLCVAPRRSEHVACSGGANVLSAGEIMFSPESAVLGVTNQSTGFCPEPESWKSVAAALDLIPLSRPDDFTTKVVFRRCLTCGQRNLVKDEWFFCGVCDAELPVQWNFSHFEGDS